MTQKTFDFVAAVEDFHETSVTVDGHQLATTPVFFAYWRFAAERQRVFFRRLGASRVAQHTSDPILSRYKFTNAYRASDRVSQYLIRNVIYRDDLPKDAVEVFFRILLFKLFNRIETWEYLERELGSITFEDYSFRRYDDLLTRRLKGGERIYSAAYIMPSASTAFGFELKHSNHLKLLEYLIAGHFPGRLGEARSMSQAFEILLTAPSFGPFLAYQYLTDLNYSEILSFDESEFVVAGPGALDGIQKCFRNSSEVPPASIIQYMQENQGSYFASLDLDFPSLWGRSLQLIDCQNLFCEISKYARVAYPGISGVGGRTRIKQKYSPAGNLPDPWYPPKWGLNEKIKNEALEVR